ALAKKGWICKKDPEAAKAVVTEYATKFPPREKTTRPGRGGQGRGGDGSGRGRRREPGASRVTTPPGHRAPPSSAWTEVPFTHTRPVPSQNVPAPPPSTHNHYPDLASSGSDEDAAAFDPDHNEVDSTNPKSSSTDYSVSNSSLTSSRNVIQAKWERKLANRRHRAAARRVSARFLSSQLSEIAQAALEAKGEHVATVVPDKEECCGDTGATDDMFPDYKAFVSYTRLLGKYAILGDQTRIKIEGIGTAVYKLNGKVIKTRHALHIPSLRAPLFSLRHHRTRVGCGVYSGHGVGSYVLFPDFTDPTVVPTTLPHIIPNDDPSVEEAPTTSELAPAHPDNNLGSETWFELFSVGYFGHDTDADGQRSKTQDQSLDGIAVGRDDRSNTIVFYNPLTRSYYRPQNFRLDEHRLPITNFPKSIKFDGGLTCGLLRDKTDPVPEPFPPGTRVTIDVKGVPTR
ncbi:hypothetical protein ACHAXR_004647, partial [Thalassiosira sp. AJA248-18]